MNPHGHTEIRAERQPIMDQIAIWIRNRLHPDSPWSIATNITFEEMKPDAPYVYHPSFTLQMHEAQELMDELWRCGLRPTEGTGSAGSLRATERHLEDMRKLTFDLLNRTTTPSNIDHGNPGTIGAIKSILASPGHSV